MIWRMANNAHPKRHSGKEPVQPTPKDRGVHVWPMAIGAGCVTGNINFY